MKTELVKVRVSPLEKQGFQQAAELAGIPLSSWMREKLRRAARIELMDAGQQVPFIQQQLRDA